MFVGDIHQQDCESSRGVEKLLSNLEETRIFYEGSRVSEKVITVETNLKELRAFWRILDVPKHLEELKRNLPYTRVVETTVEDFGEAFNALNVLLHNRMFK